MEYSNLKYGIQNAPNLGGVIKSLIAWKNQISRFPPVERLELLVLFSEDVDTMQLPAESANACKQFITDTEQEWKGSVTS